MSIGTAIFLSSLFLGIVALYAATKDRWRWRLFAKRVTLAFALMLLLGGLVWGGFYLHNMLPITVAQQTEYSRIKLGAAPSEVSYIKGTPSAVLGGLTKDPGFEGFQEIIEVKKIEKGKTINDFRDWSWDDGNSRIDVTFDPEKTKVIAVQCYSGDKLSRCPAIEGIADGSSEDEVLRRFGTPDQAEITGTTKRITYLKLGVFFLLVRQTVYMLGVNDPTWVYKK